MTRHTCAVIGLGVLSHVAAASETGRSWNLKTDDTVLTLTVVDHRLTITRLSAADADHNWAGTGMAVPWLNEAVVDSRKCPLKWTFQGAAENAAAGTLTITFTCDAPPLTLQSVWRARPGHGPVEHSIHILNRSKNRLTLPHQDSLSLTGLRTGAPCQWWWIQRGGSDAQTQGGTHIDTPSAGRELVLKSNCEDGASPVPWLAVQAGTDRGLYVGWEFSALGRISAKAGDDVTQLNLSVGLLPDFKTDIEPNETFVVPTAFVGCYAGDVDEGSYRLHRFVIEKLRPAVPAGCPDPILAYNLYLDAGGTEAREADVLRSAAFCRDLGFEAFMPDAMWFPHTGDWRWDPKRFPTGIAPIEKFVHEQGMKLALWCAWTNGGISEHADALSVRGPVGHPDWFSGDFDASWKPAAFSGGQVCLACPEARQWEIAKTQWLVAHHKLDYLKHDCGPIVNQCNKKTHRHRYGVDASYWVTKGYYEVQEKLRAAHPHVILENCSGGGHIKDFGVIQFTHYTVTTDTLSNLPDRQSIYDSTFAMPPLLLQAYTYDNIYPVKGDNPGTFLWRSAMMSAWQIDPTDTVRWTAEEKIGTQRSVQIYKDWVRPMLADVKVHHILPRPDGKRWDGLFYWSAPLKRGTLYVFRPQSDDAVKTIFLKGLDAAARYWVWSEDGSVASGARTGSDLMSQGLIVRLDQPYTCDLIYVRDAALGRPDGLAEPGEFRLNPTACEGGFFSVRTQLSWQASTNARSYMATIVDPSEGDKVIARTAAINAKADFDGLPADRELAWNVEAISYGGRRTNAGGPTRFRTPPLKPLTDVIFASDLPWISATAGADNLVRRDVNYYGKSIRIAGKTYPKGLWTHSFNDATPADIVFDIAGKDFARFAASAGIEESAGAGSVQFQVLVDGQPRAESPVMRAGTAHRFDVDVVGGKQVTLRVRNGGDGYVCDHAAWGLARFLKKTAAQDPLKDY